MNPPPQVQIDELKSRSPRKAPPFVRRLDLSKVIELTAKMEGGGSQQQQQYQQGAAGKGAVKVVKGAKGGAVEHIYSGSKGGKMTLSKPKAAAPPTPHDDSVRQGVDSTPQGVDSTPLSNPRA